MPAIAGAVGIVICLAAEQVGIQLDERYSILIEKLLKSNKEIRKGLKQIDQKLDAIILGDIDVAGIAISKLASSDLSKEQKKVELTYAIRKLEEGYSRLKHLPDVINYRAQVAAYIGICSCMNNQRSLAKEWFICSKQELKTIINMQPRNKSFVERKTEDAIDLYMSVGEFYPIMSPGFVATVLIKWAFLAPVVTALPVAFYADKKNEYNKQLTNNQEQATELMKEVEAALSCL